MGLVPGKPLDCPVAHRRALSRRWQVSTPRVCHWIKTKDPQLLIGEKGFTWRKRARCRAVGPIVEGLATHAAQRGVTVAQIEVETGLTRRTLNRLALKDNTHRVRDLVAGVKVLLSARRQDDFWENRTL